jgi:hypothetical protein
VGLVDVSAFLLSRVVPEYRSFATTPRTSKLAEVKRDASNRPWDLAARLADCDASDRRSKAASGGKFSTLCPDIAEKAADANM